MINKVVHYVWVGGKPIPKKIKNIIDNNQEILGVKWKAKIWTEKDFDIESNPYTKYWYKKKQWAFVSDYIRAYAVYKEGGFYLDTDVVLSKSLDSLLKYDYVASRTNVVWNTLSCFGAVKNHIISKRVLELASHPKMMKKPPRIMSTHIHGYAINSCVSPSIKNEDFVENNIAILTEDQLQIDLKNKKNIAIHEHHDNWKGSSDLSVSKYYYNKVKFYETISDEKISHEFKKRTKKFNKIKKLTGLY